MSRVTLEDGDWIDLTDRLNYAQARRVSSASGTGEAAGVLVATMATDWALRDVEGQSVPFPGAAVDGVPLDALSRIPWDTFTRIAAAAADILPEQPDPKDTAGTSPGSPPASPSPSRRTSRMPTSLPTTQGGPGMTSARPPTM